MIYECPATGVCYMRQRWLFIHASVVSYEYIHSITYISLHRVLTQRNRYSIQLLRDCLLQNRQFSEYNCMPQAISVEPI